jgi:Cu/Ag efflux pump CusA
MFDAIIAGSLKHRGFVVAITLLLAGLGVFEASRMPLDVLPELSAPSVTVVTEVNGMAPEEVERLVTVPLEQALNGASGLRRLRSRPPGGHREAHDCTRRAAAWHRARAGARLVDHGRDHVRRLDWR